MVNKRLVLKTSFEFDSAHRLVGYIGKCSNIHGHIWHVDVRIMGTTKQLDCNGILWDFSNIKSLKELFDHKLILKNCSENIKIIKSTMGVCQKDSIYLMDKNPTAENLCEEIILHLKTSNPDLKYHVRVYESPKNSCEVER